MNKLEGIMKYITEKEYMELMEMLKTSFRKFDDQFADMQAQFTDLRKEMNDRFDKVDQRLDKIEERLDKIDERLYYHETWLKRIESNMATKTQLKSLVGILERNGAISSFDSAHILHNPPERER